MTSRDFAPSTLVSGKALAGLATYAGRSLVGGRTNNEDGFVCALRIGLFAVADGMGGHNAGEVASALALDTLATALRERKALPTWTRQVAWHWLGDWPGQWTATGFHRQSMKTH